MFQLQAIRRSQAVRQLAETEIDTATREWRKKERRPATFGDVRAFVIEDDSNNQPSIPTAALEFARSEGRAAVDVTDSDNNPARCVIYRVDEDTLAAAVIPLEKFATRVPRFDVLIWVFVLVPNIGLAIYLLSVSRKAREAINDTIQQAYQSADRFPDETVDWSDAQEQREPLDAMDDPTGIVKAFNMAHVAAVTQLGIFRGITHANSAERDLLASILNAMGEGVLAVDADRRVLFANETVRPLLDITVDDPVGRPLLEATRQKHVSEVVTHVLEHGSPTELEFENARTNAIVVLNADRLSADDAAEQFGAIVVAHDITELRRLEGMRRTFVSNVSHELKTPLTAIQTMTETLLDGAIDDPEISRKFLGRLRESSDRLRTLILDLLSLARIEAQQIHYDTQPVSVRATVATCIRAHQTKAEKKNIAIRSQATEDCHVLADEEEFLSILDNLVDNAISYTPEGGDVSIHYHTDGRFVEIVVKDSGIGIAEKYHTRIFERFYRVDKARSREQGGTGLGLAIVKHLVKVFAGEISLDSQEGAGSTFTVRLPQADA